MNSSFTNYVVDLINPTMYHQVGDIARLPAPKSTSKALENLVETAICTARCWNEEDETSFTFMMPPQWPDGIDQIGKRKSELQEIESNIDYEIYRLYGLADEDRKLIEVELGGEHPLDTSEEATEPADQRDTDKPMPDITKEDLAAQWVSYVIGAALGRFKPGIPDSPGRGCFAGSVNHKIREFASRDGILAMEIGDPRDLPRRTYDILRVMLGEAGARQVVKANQSKNGDAIELLRQYILKDFLKHHVKQYRKRPVYWFLQSPKNKYGVWVFHERLTKDSLFSILSEYVEPKIRLLEGQIANIQKKADAAGGKEKRKLEDEVSPLQDVLDDVREFVRGSSSRSAKNEAIRLAWMMGYS
jgi:hypothetical protein